MSKTVKIAISLPQDVLEAAELERRVRGESRSEFFRHAVEIVLLEQKKRREIERYIQGYREFPETAEEVALAQSSALQALSPEPWE